MTPSRLIPHTHAPANLMAFLKESRAIEGLVGRIRPEEKRAAVPFLAAEYQTVDTMCRLVSGLQPRAILRSQFGVNVRVAEYAPPQGGPSIVRALERLLRWCKEHRTPAGAYEGHVLYEMLHPFTDGNGRSGRVLWLWMMHGALPRGAMSFLHAFYYQSLAAQSRMFDPAGAVRSLLSDHP